MNTGGKTSLTKDRLGVQNKIIFRTEEPTKTLDEWELNAISEFWNRDWAVVHKVKDISSIQSEFDPSAVTVSKEKVSIDEYWRHKIHSPTQLNFTKSRINQETFYAISCCLSKKVSFRGPFLLTHPNHFNSPIRKQTRAKDKMKQPQAVTCCGSEAE
jgi:hypothetical protein